MEEFLVGSVRNMIPVYLLAFVAGELILFLKEKKGLLVEIIAASIICVAVTVVGQIYSFGWAVENRPVLLAVVNFLTVLMPLIVFVAANQFLVRIPKVLLKHATLLAVVTVTMFIWPLWALYVTCASGLDCL